MHKMDAKFQRKEAQASNITYAEKVRNGGGKSKDFQQEMKKCTAIVCIDATYAKVAAGVLPVAEKLQISIVALVAGGKGRWKVVTQGERERDLLLQEKTLIVDGREATIIGHKPLHMLYVEAEYPIVSKEEVQECFELHAKVKVVRMEKLRHSQLWTGIWLVWTTFQPSQRISKWQGRGFSLKVEDRSVTKPMKQDAAPAVVRDEEKPREEKRSEESAAAAFPEPAVVEDEEKQESEDGSTEEVAQPTLETFHSPEVSDAEEETRETRDDAKDLPTQVEESRKHPQEHPQQSSNQQEVNKPSSGNQQRSASSEEEERRDVFEDNRDQPINVDEPSIGNPQEKITSRKKQIELLKGEISEVANQIAVPQATHQRPKVTATVLPRMKPKLVEEIEVERKTRGKGHQSLKNQKSKH